MFFGYLYLYERYLYKYVYIKKNIIDIYSERRIRGVLGIRYIFNELMYILGVINKILKFLWKCKGLKVRKLENRRRCDVVFLEN